MPSAGRLRPSLPAIAGVALAESLLIAVELRTRLPDITASRSSVLGTAAGHGHGGPGSSGSAPSVVANAVPHFAGLAILAAHLVLAVLFVLCGLLRGRFGDSDGWRARVGFAAVAAVAAAMGTFLVAWLALRGAFTSGELLAIAIDVLRWGFVLALLAGLALGPLWQKGERQQPFARSLVTFERPLDAQS